jgi:hypothetical protein
MVRPRPSEASVSFGLKVRDRAAVSNIVRQKVKKSFLRCGGMGRHSRRAPFFASMHFGLQHDAARQAKPMRRGVTRRPAA